MKTAPASVSGVSSEGPEALRTHSFLFGSQFPQMGTEGLE